jgi:glycerol-3-phosphate acyltransferase PlsY
METLLHNWWMQFIAAGLIGYLLGAISFARLIVRLFSPTGQIEEIDRPVPNSDLRFQSNSISATTVNLNLGARYGCLTALLDMLKVSIPTALVWYYFPIGPHYLCTALMGMAGHIYPLYHGFKGGRGMSPLIGGLLVINWFGILVANLMAVVLGYFFGSVLVMRWGWLITMIVWMAWYFGDPWYIAYIVLANALFWFSMRAEIKRFLEIRGQKKTTQEEISDFLFMGKKFGRFLDNYGFPALLKRMF